MNNVLDAFHLEFANFDFVSSFFWILLIVFLAGLFALKVRQGWLKKVSCLIYRRLGKICFRAHFLTLLINLAILAGLGLLVMKPDLFRTDKVPVHEKLYIYPWLDFSKSSLSDDIVVEVEGKKIKISRLAYQKQEVLNLLDKLKEDYFSLGIFAGKAYPLTGPDVTTKDYKSVVYREVEMLDAEVVWSLPQGTNLGAAIYYGTLSNRKSSRRSRLPKGIKRIVIVLTDGEEQGDMSILNQDLDDALKAAKEHEGDTSFYIVGVGNPREAALIPVPGAEFEYETDSKGRFIRTRPDWFFLSEIAKKLGGTFVPAQSGEDLANALETILLAERSIVGEKTIKRREARFVRMLAVALIGALVLLRYQEP